MAEDREAIGELPNPLGLAGIEFIEYSTARPQALGQVLERMGFRPVARHRSREVLLYRQGPMNIIVNAHHAQEGDPDAAPSIAAVALRVRDAGAAYRRALERGAWAVPIHVEPMELHIPAIHGVGTSRLYFVDRWQEFSIYDVDFIPIPTVERQPASVAGFRWFGVVQYIGNDRTEDWSEFYRELFGFSALPDERRFGILPKGRVLRSPCGGFYWQLIEPEPGILDVEGDEMLNRVAFGTLDVMRAVDELRARGVEFVESSSVHSETRGALTQPVLGGVAFELVHDERSAP
ncbi:MAG TPA: 4-hydroxyphenylpyruvate dioxygenase [Albitalea sp.]|uniref:4-hydroxyphenylpyruvate dioxygenase n=1 Tax=Piscinibacter sp. TaxID=1903157 RepID=UPI002ED54005